jgi:hypothetical protein
MPQKKNRAAPQEARHHCSSLRKHGHQFGMRFMPAWPGANCAPLFISRELVLAVP